MKFSVKNNYKSFRQSTVFDSIPQKFIILTGENGSGKTHFLNAIGEGIISIDGNVIDKKDIVQESFISIQSKIVANSSGSINAHATNIHNVMIQNSPVAMDNKITIGSKVYVIKDLIKDIKTKYPNPTKDQIKTWIYEQVFRLHPFQGNFLGDIFRDYKMLMINNYICQMQGKPFLNDVDFVRKYGAKPWDILNDILNKQINLNFRFEEPEIIDFSSQYNVVCKNGNGDFFLVSDISSGEKTLLSVVISLFSSISNKISAVKLILLDELDCSLHPSMIKNLLYLLDEIFVKKHGISVILTTHSPTTVALARNESLYYVSSDNANRIRKKDKEFILKQLAYKLPLTVSDINRKDIITEGEYDAINLGNIYRKLTINNLIRDDISFNFIPSGVNKGLAGGCERVCSLVEGFSGAKDVYGILDWDTKNKSKEKIFVLAENERYSIENCILDPVLIALLLLHNIQVPIFNPTDIGLKNTFVLTKDFAEFRTNAQKISDSIVNKLKFKDVSNTRLIKYINGICINIPVEYLEYNGHDLETQLKKTFPKLAQYHNNNCLKEAVINVLGYYPEFIPMCFKEVFEKIIEN